LRVMKDGPEYSLLDLQNLPLDTSLRNAVHFITFYFFAININITFISRTKISKVNSMR